MQTVTVTRVLDAPPDRIRAAMADLEPFMRAAGFDEVTVDGDRLTIAKRVGLVTIELDLECFDDPDAVLAYRQRDGIFDEMETRYTLVETETGTEVSATTHFAVEARLVGPLLDATVVKRQRRIELNAQFDYLESLEE